MLASLGGASRNHVCDLGRAIAYVAALQRTGEPPPVRGIELEGTSRDGGALSWVEDQAVKKRASLPGRGIGGVKGRSFGFLPSDCEERGLGRSRISPTSKTRLLVPADIACIVHTPRLEAG